MLKMDADSRTGGSASCMLWFYLATLLVGFVLLIWSAHKFVDSAANTAQNYGVSKLIIGLTVVSVGTSAPEILVAVVASLERNEGVAIGNAIGSNIANIGLVLGITAMLTPLPFAQSVLKSEMPWLLIATVVTGFCLVNLYLGRIDGIILLLLLAAVLYRLFRSSRRDEAVREEIAKGLQEIPTMSRGKAMAWMLGSLVVLMLSAEFVVFGASETAKTLGVSDMVIGLTVVAVGTSLPELAVTVRSALDGHPEIAVGNVVGSNILNILAVLAVPALLQPSTLLPIEFWRDFGAMFIFTAMLALFAYGIRSQKVVSRLEGLVLFVCWLSYFGLVFYQSTMSA